MTTLLPSASILTTERGITFYANSSKATSPALKVPEGILTRGGAPNEICSALAETSLASSYLVSLMDGSLGR
jgi:hypothetical protein